MDQLQAEQAAQQPGFELVALLQVEQSTQRIGSYLGIRLQVELQVEEVAQLPGWYLGLRFRLGLWHDRCASHEAIEHTGWN
ncbi:hypothetical protein M0R45_002026 [Rubus argutus]|uniref:Uncharacterized protein n=1 Tax=Rubus argutus TaxID=59490 RepID=A0AAW1VJD2_RUBAR